MTRQRRTAVLAASAGVALVLVATALVWFAMRSSQNVDTKSAMECTLEWGRLARIPASAKDVDIRAEGSAFTRAFRLAFAAPADDIERWLRDSDGINKALLIEPSPGARHFDIRPGGGAQHAEVDVDDIQHKVSVYVCWS